MSEEQYQPSPEEMEKAQEMADDIQNMRGEEMMSDDQKDMSEERDVTLKENKKWIIEWVSGSSLDFKNTRITEGEFSLPEEFIASPEVQEAVKERMMKEFSTTYLIGTDNVLKIRKGFDLPDEFIASPEVQEGATKRMIKELSSGQLNDVRTIKEEFNLPDSVKFLPEMQEAARKNIIKNISRGLTNNILLIKEGFELPDNFISSYEFREAAKEGIIYDLSHSRYHYEIVGIKDRFEGFNIPENVVQEAAKEGLDKLYSEGARDVYERLFLKIKEEFNLF